MYWLTAISLALSLLASLLLVPQTRRVALWAGIVDRPDRDRKLQRAPIALGGGVAVFLSVMVAVLVTLTVDRAFFGGLLGVTPEWYVLLGAAVSMLLVGLLDDACAMRGRQKLLLQCLIIAALVGSGTVIEKLTVMSFDIHLGLLAFPVTVVWLLLSVNALNLIDGADGMATTAGCVICAGLGILSLRGDPALTAVLAFGLAGALLGFLVFNKPPAKIYLGDAGSMTIGLCVGVLAIWSSVKESTVLASAPVAILAIPLFDSSAAILRRWLTGRSIYASDRAHLHHLLQERFGPVKMLIIVAGLCVTTTTLSVLSVLLHQPWLAAVGVLIVLALLIVTRSFGHAEFGLLMGRATRFAQSFATTPAAKHHRRFPLQGVGHWEKIWEPLVDYAKSHDFAKLKIDLNLSWLQEGYHATWQSVRLPEKEAQLSLCVPLFATRTDGQIQIGRLEIIAAANAPEVYERVSELGDLLVDLGPQIDRIVFGLESPKRTGHSVDPVNAVVSETPPRSDKSETAVPPNVSNRGEEAGRTEPITA